MRGIKKKKLILYISSVVVIGIISVIELKNINKVQFLNKELHFIILILIIFFIENIIVYKFPYPTHLSVNVW